MSATGVSELSASAPDSGLGSLRLARLVTSISTTRDVRTHVEYMCLLLPCYVITKYTKISIKCGRRYLQYASC